MFDTDCWDHFIAYYDQLRCVFPREKHDQIIARYSLAYESKALHNVLKENNG